MYYNLLVVDLCKVLTPTLRDCDFQSKDCSELDVKK